MTNKNLLITVYSWLMRFLHMQLFITLGSLPILICWGLPLSIMSPIGNLLFTPFLMAFLLLSSIIFFLELLCMPSSYLVFLLEKTVYWWQWTLNCNDSSWLISFAKPSILFFVILLSATFLMVHHRKISRPPLSVIGFSLLLIFAIGYLKFQNKPIRYFTIPCNNGELSIFRNHNQTILIDPGYLGQRTSSNQWIEYTLLPMLNKTFGINTIDHVIVLQPSISTLEALTHLCNQTKVKHIYLISWQGTAQKSFYRNYGILKKMIEEKKISLLRTGNYKRIITISNTCSITILPLEKKLSYQEITFPALQVRIEMDNQEITIYSAKMKKQKGD